MATGYVQLPQYRAPNRIDFRQFGEGMQAIGEGIAKNRLLDERKEIGEAVQSGDYGSGAKAAYGQGNLKLGLSLDEAQRQRKADQRQSQLQDWKLKKTKADIQQGIRERTGRMARYIKGVQDPDRKAQLAQRFFNSHPRFRQQLDASGVDMANPDTALDYLIAEAGVDRPDLMKFKPGERAFDPSTRQFVGGDGDAAGAVDPYEHFRRKKAAEAEGKVEGEERGNLPKTVAKADRMLNSIDAALGDPALGRVTGWYSGRAMNLSEGAARAQSRLDQIRGQTFLQAYQDLKGGGQITEIEGSKAEDALARINTQEMNDEDYRAALNDLRDVVVKGLRRSKGLSVEDDTMQSLSNAREAIQSGKPRARIIQRLRENGIDPTGL